MRDALAPPPAKRAAKKSSADELRTVTLVCRFGNEQGDALASSAPIVVEWTGTVASSIPSTPAPDAVAECTVDIKNFAKVMQTSLLNPRGVILCLENNTKCTVYKLGDANDAAWLTFHLPVLYT